MTAHNSLDEKELLIKLQSGDRVSFERLYNTYSDRIYSKLLKLTKAEDIANELYQFYRKVARDKKLQAHIIDTFTEAYSHTEEDIYLKESRELLNRAIDQLSPQRKEVFNLCKIEGKSYDEAASLLGISPSTVSNHLVKANTSIRKYLFHSKESIALLLAALMVKGL